MLLNQAEKQEQAEALGFASVAEMDDHQRWIQARAAQRANALAYQDSPEARLRAAAACREFGLLAEQVAFIEPLVD